MNYKIPKVLNRKPVVAGFKLVSVIIIVGCALLFLFTAFNNFLVSLLFPGIVVIHLFMEKKYPGDELLKLINYTTRPKCIRVDRNISRMLVKIVKEPVVIVKEKQQVLEVQDDNKVTTGSLHTWINTILQKLTPQKIKPNTNQNAIANEQN